MACRAFQSLGVGLLFPRIPDTQMCANFRPPGHGWGRRGERIGMKYRVLVGLLVLFGLGVCISCGGAGSTSTTTNPGVTGTGAVFVVTQGDNLISPFLLDRAAGKMTTNGKGVATGSLPSAVIQTPSGDGVFVLNTNSNDISRYTVKTDGTLTAVTPHIS